jgi:hypothetical protein
MNVIESYLHHALAIPVTQLPVVLSTMVMDSPFADSLLPLIPSLLAAEPSLTDELWKFSVTLNVPHKLLFDAFHIQTSLNQQLLPLSKAC